MRWNSFVYYFVVGGLVFLIGFIIPWFSGDWSWKKKEDRLIAIFMFVGFAAYFLGYLFWQLHALGKI